MIRWTGEKNIDLLYINHKILECMESKIFSNFGKNTTELQIFIKNKLLVEDDKEVILTCNGAMGLNAIIGMYNSIHNKTLKWASQSFTFPCSVQGLLKNNCIIIDIDGKHFGPDLQELENKKDEYDGVIITNCFGKCVDIDIYVDFCKANNKILLFDNAATSFTFYKNKNVLNYGDACMVSLHHTKPIGFGEGGFVVIKKEYVDIMNKMINFGYDSLNKTHYDTNASNYKMSEIQAIYIQSYLNSFDDFHKKIVSLYNHFLKLFYDYNFQSISVFPNFSDDNPLLSCIPLLFNKDIDKNYFINKNIEAKKYYYPLEETKNAKKLYNNIICFPLHYSMNLKNIEYYIECLKNYENKII